MTAREAQQELDQVKIENTILRGRIAERNRVHQIEHEIAQIERINKALRQELEEA